MSPVTDRPPLVRAAASITVLNVISRLTGFARVIAISAALGVTALGDVYQATNVVSNVLFEILAGGVFASVLVPTFTAMVDRGAGVEARALAGALLGRVLVLLGSVVVVALVAAPLLAGLLTSTPPGGGDPEPLATFLLWFFIPQVLFYAVGGVATSLLHAHHRFVAAAAAPVANNLVVIATMVAFRAAGGSAGDLDITLAQKLVLALGTTGGVVAMSVVPALALARINMLPVPSLAPAAVRPLLQRGAWAAGHLGINQVMALAVVVFAARTEGGVVANQLAMTFFFLPHAVLAHPVYTALFPRLAGAADRHDDRAFALQLTQGFQLSALVLAPAAAIVALAGTDVMDVARLGALDASGADFAGEVLAGYAVGLVGYSVFFLFTRAAWARDDVRTPTLVNAAMATTAIAGMAVVAATVDGTGLVVGLALIQSAAFTVGAVVLYLRVRPGLPGLRLAGPTVRTLVAGAAAAGGAAAGVLLVPGSGRLSSGASVMGSSVLAVLAALAALWAIRAPELAVARASLGRRPAR